MIDYIDLMWYGKGTGCYAAVAVLSTHANLCSHAALPGCESSSSAAYIAHAGPSLMPAHSCTAAVAAATPPLQAAPAVATAAVAATKPRHAPRGCAAR